MRLNHLDLTRYGIFTDYPVAFGERKAGVPDLHIIYGPNEAGKSTMLAAFLDLLFGIESRSRYDFLHPYSTMRIGGALEINGAVHEFARVKRPQNSLLDGKGQPVSDGAILGDLGGVDRDSYATMFSLDDDTLEAGGESILASKGDLGQLLFSASAGLSNLSRTLIDLRGEADGFYRFRARSGELSDLKTRLAELKAERERIDTLASEYARLVETRDRTAAQYDEAITTRGQIQTRMEELQHQMGALPRLVALRGIRERLKPFADLPDAPLGWAKELPQLQKDEIELATRTQGIEAEIQKISAEVNEIVIDERALGDADRIDRLADLRARYMTADKDIPERHLQLKEADLTISGILTRMECEAETDPCSLLLGASTVGALRELIESRSGVEAAMEAADGELAEARRRLVHAQAKLKSVGGKTDSGDTIDPSTSFLASVVSVVRADDHATRRRLADRSRNEHLEALSERMLLLRPWTGNAEELLKLSIPEPGDIERWRTSISEAQKTLDRYDGEIEKFTTDQCRLTAELDAISDVTGVVSDQEAASVRAAREDAWASHKRALDEGSAEAFEAMLRRDDIVMNARLGNAAEVAKLNQTSQSLTIVKADLDRTRKSRDAAAATLQRIYGEIAAAIRAMTLALPDDLTLSQLESWLDRREKALDTRSALKEAERDIQVADADGGETRRKLVEALTSASIAFEVDASVDALTSLAQAAIDRATEVKALRSDVGERERDLNVRERGVEKVTEAEQTWSRRLAELCSNCWLGNRGSTPALTTVREVLKALDELCPVVEKRVGLADRIRKMEDDQRRFAVEVEALAEALGWELQSLRPLDLAARLVSAVDKARAAQSAHAGGMKRLKDAGARKNALVEAQKIHDRRKVEMMKHFGVASLAEVDAKLRDIEKRSELQSQALAAEQDILDALGVSSIDEAEDKLDNVDRSVVDIELAELKVRFEDQDRRTRELFTEHSKASDQVEAVGGDDAVAKIEERRRTTLLEIEEGAVRYLRLRLGVAAAEQALRAYRDQHRSSMMARASDAFRTISRGAYKGLTTQPEKDNEVLIAVGANDGSKVASALSKGTRFQLYLALRVAGFYEFAQSRRPVPFVADDIMETFDDFRAEEAFKLFAEMAEVGQVIYLTHHQHLCEIARRVCPEVQVHELEVNGV